MERDGGSSSSSSSYMPAAGMVTIQVIGATVALLNRAALVKGMSPPVFVFYRQAIATLFIFPIALVSATMKKGSLFCLGLRSFLLIFTLSIIGVVLNQNLYFEGLYLASSSIASAISNLVPAITFLIAALFGLERVNMRRWSTLAKIVGTATCVGGAASIALLKGPKLLNASNSVTLRLGWASGGDTWLLGCLFLFANSCSWSLWLILQVPTNAACPDHLAVSAWMCFISTIQSGLVALVLEPHPEAWNLTSTLELTCVFFSGIAGSGLQFVIQSWCISRRGPLFSAMFNPLSTVIVTVLAAIFLHEQIFVGSLMGSAAVIAGLYVVLWGKSVEMEEKREEQHMKGCLDCHKKDLEQPLVAESNCDRNVISGEIQSP